MFMSSIINWLLTSFVELGHMSCAKCHIFLNVSVRFPQWEEFELQYSTSQMKDGYQKLHRELEPFLLRRIKKDVEKSLPSKVSYVFVNLLSFENY